MILDGLKQLDDVAYARFASVYRDFQAAEDFKDVIEELSGDEPNKNMTLSEDERWMQAALQLGRRHLGRTSTNPSVGCLIVKNNSVIGRGTTAISGRPHAETQALAEAGRNAEHATAYVTLEPCAHHGKTPPCCEALVSAKLSRVVIACQDPNPQVAGQGMAYLRAAGVEVVEHICAEQAQKDHAAHILRIKQKRLLSKVSLRLQKMDILGHRMSGFR